MIMKNYIKAVLFILIVLPFSIFFVACNNNKVDTYYTVTFNSKGGSEVASVQVKKDELLSQPENPTQEDFIFLGWFYEDKEWSFAENTVNQDLTLTAKWEHTYLLIDEDGLLTGITDDGKNLETIKIPKSVTSVKEGALSGCSSLESLTIPFVGNSADITSSDANQYPFGYLFGTESFAESVQTEQVYFDPNKYNYTEITYHIPSKLTSVTITGGDILPGAFLNCSNLTNISLQDNVTSIGYGAFYGCSNLQYNIYNDAKYLGNSENQHLALVETSSQSTTFFIIPSNTKIIGDCAFYGYGSLESISIPNSVTSIGDSAFEDCSSLKRVSIPSSIKYIGNSAFYGCDNLQYNENEYAKYLGNSENSYLVLIEVDTTITSFSIESNTKIIGDYAFYDCSSLESISIPDSVICIGEGAFYYCSSLESISIPNGVTSIGIATFCNCSSLESISIPDSVKKIGIAAFCECSSLKSVTFESEDNLTSIGDYAFEDCSSLESILIPNSVTSIGDSAFYGCNTLESISIPKNVVSIGENAFYECSNLKSVAFESASKLTSIGNAVFYWCSSLESISIPNSVVSIGNDAFCDCRSLKSISIPEGVTSIGNRAFYWCSSLESISIPSSLISIGADVFYGCSNFKYNTYENVNYLGNTENPYLLLAGVSSTSITSCAVNNNTKFIDEYAFYCCRSLESISIPNSIISIGARAFYNCNSLTSFSIPEGVTSINEETFFCCTNLINITIPNSVKTIENSAFEGCNNLQNITIPDSVISIGYKAFYECNSLTEITIPNGITRIDSQSFYGCSSLTKVTIPNGVTYIGFKAFEGCSSLESITIPDGVTIIDQFAFKNCSKLKSLTIPISVRQIGYAAFINCSSLESITLPDTIVGIDSNTFYGCSNLKYNTYENANYLGNAKNPYLVLVKASSTEITSCKIHSNTQIIMEDAFRDCNSLESVTFENPESWVVAENYILNSPTSLSSADLSNEKTAATFLTSTYLSYYWKRI